MTSLSKILIPSLKSVIMGTARKHEISLLIKAAQQFGTIRLLQIIRKHPGNIEIYPHNISSIALDFIAELFQRDEENKFFEIAEYFTEERDIEILSDEEILDEFRTIIFSKLNDGIIRLYRDRDPFLAKIIRNLKIAIKKSNRFYLFNRFGDLYIGDQMTDLEESKSIYPLDGLEKEFHFGNAKSNKVIDYLETIFTILHQSEYRKFYSLMDVAFIIKRIVSRHNDSFQTLFQLDEDLHDIDVRSIVNSSLAELKEILYFKYVAKKKIDEKEYSALYGALNEFVERTYIFTDGHDLSHFDYLRNQLPTITHEEYRKHHRVYFEYMTKLAKKHIESNLKELLY